MQQLKPFLLRYLKVACSAATLVTQGCGDRANSVGEESALYDDPIVRVATRDTQNLIAELRGWHLQPRRVRRFGAEDGDEAFTFHKIAALDLPQNVNSFCVLDRGLRRLSCFDETGRVVSSFGRRGHGPGEFEDPVSMAWLDEFQRFIVLDPAENKIKFLTSSGKQVRSAGIPGTRPYSLVSSPLGYGATTVRETAAGLVMQIRSDAFTTKAADQRGYLVLLDSAGTVKDTLLAFRVAGVAAEHRESSKGSYSSWTRPKIFLPEPTWDVFDNGDIVFVPGGTYDIYVIDVQTGHLRHISKPSTPQAVTRADRLRFLEQTAAETPQGAPVWALERIGRKRFVKQRPMLTGTLVADERHFWVRRFDTSTDGRGWSNRWDVYSRFGEFKGDLVFPARFTPLRVNDGTVYGVYRDSLGVEYVEIYDLAGAGDY